LAGNVLVDYKSVSSPSVDTMQFKQYIQYWQPNPNPTNPPLRSFKYVFNGDKIADTATIRQRFYTTFKNNPTGYFLVNPDFFTRFLFNVAGVPTRVNAANIVAFIDAIDKTHLIFNFVTIKP
jgi:triacylglycerol esterase/lipase EstA (alpha/beta hydrolase family)